MGSSVSSVSVLFHQVFACHEVRVRGGAGGGLQKRLCERNIDGEGQMWLMLASPAY